MIWQWMGRCIREKLFDRVVQERGGGRLVGDEWGVWEDVWGGKRRKDEGGVVVCVFNPVYYKVVFKIRIYYLFFYIFIASVFCGTVCFLCKS